MSQRISTELEFNHLFGLYYEELCKIAYTVVKDLHTAEDLVQDVFVKVWLRREELEINTNAKAYLYKAVVFRALDYLRKQKNSHKFNAELTATQAQSANNVAASLEEKELLAAINEGLDKLPENTRLIFHLSRFSGLKNREIAEQLDISIKTVESNMARALKLLHKQLKPFLKQGAAIIFYLLME